MKAVKEGAVALEGVPSGVGRSLASLSGVRALLLDVDGTLYRQRPVRARMAVEIALLPVTSRSLRHARRVARAIGEFRRVREELRDAGAPGRSLAVHQFEETARRTGIDAAAIERIVTEWMFRRPLPHVARAKRAGLDGFLARVAHAGLRVGALSDYPVADKLHALGVGRHFSVALCTTDPAINAFKPHPRGFLEACRIWGLQPREVLYVGDRPDVDATGANAAGMPCAIIEGLERDRASGQVRDYLAVRGFDDLGAAMAAG